MGEKNLSRLYNPKVLFLKLDMAREKDEKKKLTINTYMQSTVEGVKVRHHRELIMGL